MAKRLSICFITVIVLAIMLALVFCGLNHSGDTAYATIYNYQDTTFDINSQHDFDSFAQAFSQSGQYFNGKTIYLNCSVNMGEFGSLFHNFNGTFYGNGHAINGVKNAFFGNEIGSAGKVYGLVLNNIDISTANATVAVTNKGQLKDITVIGNITYHTIGGLVYDNYGSITDSYNFAHLDASAGIDSQGVGGIAYNNYGSIVNSHFLGNITVNNTIKTLGGLVAHNNVLASVEKSSVTGEIHILSTGDENYDSVIPQDSGMLIGNNLGILKNSYFIGYYTLYLSMAATVVGDDQLIDAPQPYQNIYAMTQDACLVYDNVAQGFTELEGEDISLYFDFSQVQGLYVNETNAYPIFSMLDGQGTQESPFLVSSVFDLYKLRSLYNNVGVEYLVYLADDIECRNYNLEIALQGFAYTTIVDGQGFALKNFTSAVLFTSNQQNILQNVGFYDAPLVELDGTLFDETSGYDYGGWGGLVNDVAKAQPAIGAGTAQDPYVITSLAELAYLDGSDAHFKMGNSIVVNSATNLLANYLNINSFGGVLDGNGHVVVGLFEPLVVENSGTVKNLTVKGAYSQGGAGAVACTNQESGVIDSVNVYASILADGLEWGGVAYQNNGIIHRAKVLGNDATQYSTVGGVAWKNNVNGVVENCFVYMENNYVFAQENLGDIYSSIGKDTEFVAVDSNVQVEMNYFSLVASGFDVKDIFGYEINTPKLYPTLREPCVQYKAESDFIYDKARSFNYTYAPSTNYLKANIQNLMKTEKHYITTGSWSYNGEEFDQGTTIKDAGLYQVTLTFNGDNLLLPSRYTQNVVINKQAQSNQPTFDGSDFDNLTYQYSGSEQAINQPQPNNLLDCGYTYSYALMQGVNVVSQAKDAGVYTQVIKGQSQNYTDVTVSRTITISKKDITINVGNLSVDYLQGVNLSSAELIINGLVSSDEVVPINQLVKDGPPQYSTNYVAGDNVGEYYIDYLAEFINYTVTDTAKGKLFVNKIDLEQGDMVFADMEITYTSADISILVQNLPQGVSVVYDNNTYKNAGQYLVTATLSKPNYNNLILTATLTIAKATLNIKPKDMTLGYNMARTGIDEQDFDCDITGALGQDMDTIISVLDISYTVTKDGEQATTFDVGDYQIDIAVLGTLDNYKITKLTSTLNIVPAKLTVLYLSHDSLSVPYSGETITHYITFFETAIVYEYYKDDETVDYCVDAGVYTVLATVPKINDNYLDTVYEYTITIVKKDLEISFSQASYTVEYDKTNKFLIQNYPYLGTLPSGLSADFGVKKDGDIVAEAINAGTYLIFYTVAESTNYLRTTISAYLIIAPKALSITIEPSYTYSGNNVVPEITQIEGVIDQDVTVDNFTFEYYNSQGVRQDRVTTVGSYTTWVTLDSPNYALDTSDYDIAVEKLAVSVDLKYLEFTYGQTGSMTYNGITYEIYSGGIIERKNYFVTQTRTSVDIRYQTASEHAGTYTIESLSVGENYHFTIAPDSQLDNNNKVKINPVTLHTIWRFGSVDISGISKVLAYNGTDQFVEFGYTIVGFVKNHKQGDFAFEAKERSSKQLFDVGKYSLIVNLLNENNYIMGNNDLEVTIEKAVLNVKMLDTEVFKGEQFIRRYQVLNTVGADSQIGNIYSLKGASLQVKTDYTQSAQVGAEYEYYFTGTFTNYVLNITQTGMVKVVHNPKVDVTFPDDTFVYDGTYKSLKVVENQEYINNANIELTYSANNLQKDVGSYSISLVVTYNIDGSQKHYQRTLKIIKGTPSIVLEPHQKTVYRDSYKLLPKDIKGKAYLGQDEIAGTFIFTQDYILQKTTKQDGYNVKFIPADTKNLNEVDATYYIETLVLGQSALVYDDTSKITYTQGGVEIADRVTITLNNDIIDGLTLYSNDRLVSAIVLDKAQDIVIKIKYQGQVAFLLELAVTMEEKKDNEPIVADATYLDLISGLKIDKNMLLVSSMGGRIGIKAEYADNYELYINGVRTDTNYPISGDEGSIVVSIVDARRAITVFSEEYTVVEDAVIDQMPAEKDYRVLIITASVIGATAVVAVVFLFARRAIRDKKIGFNPYNKK